MKFLVSVICLCLLFLPLNATSPNSISKDTKQSNNSESRYEFVDPRDGIFVSGYKAFKAGNFKQAVKWYTKAAEQGHAPAQHSLGLMFGNGIGLPQNKKQAVEWYTLAAEQGHAGAQSLLGVAYYLGEGVLQDYKIAANWVSKAAEQKDVSSQSLLGSMYYDGEGVPQDYREALKWLTKAAEQGEGQAQNRLGAMYYYGHGVIKDYAKSYAWANIGAANTGSSKVREIISEIMTPTQIAEGQKLSREMVEANPKLLGN